MIFGLPAILGLIPLLLYIVLSLKEVHPFVGAVISLGLVSILGNVGLMGLAKGIYAGASSFLGVIGVLVMFGGGLAEILNHTGSAEVLVKGIMSKFPLSKKGIILGTMFCQIIMVMLLGSNLAAGAVLATVAIALAARCKVSSPAMAIAFHTSAAAGLILGPFTAPVVQQLQITGWNYLQFVWYVGLPYAILLFGTGVFMAFRAEKKYGEQGENLTYQDEAAATIDTVATQEAKRGAKAFILTIIPLVVYGIYIKGGLTYALLLLPLLAGVVGLSCKYKAVKVMEVFFSGASRMLWIFLLFVIFDPLLNFTAATGAFDSLNGLLTPFITAFGVPGFTFVTSAIGVFGLSGVGPAEVVLLEKMFKTMATDMGVSLPLYITILWVGSQITSFAYPGGEMFIEMGYSRSKHLKSMVINGWVVTGMMMVYVMIRGFLNM